MSIPTSGYPNSQNQTMYGHQPMQRVMSGGQLNSVMHPSMMITSSQSHMMSASGYPQTMMNTGQPPPQMISTISSQQQHMGQAMNTSHMVGAASMGQQTHVISSQHQQPSNASISQVQVVGNSVQQSYIQHQQTTPSSVSLLSSGPSSNNPQTPLTMPSMNPSSQQIGTPVTPQQAPSSVQTSASTVESNSGGLSIVPPDPISLAKNLILKDLRYSLIELNKAAAEVIRPSVSKQQLDASVASHNPMSVNPQSVNPQSVNPQSVNPLSVNPASVKSLDDPNSVEAADKKAILCPRDAYLNAFNNFLAICDQIEMNFSLVQEAQKQCVRFDKMFAGELKAVGEMANVNYSQYAQGYIDSADRIRTAIHRSVQSATFIIDKLQTAEENNYYEKMEL